MEDRTRNTRQHADATVGKPSMPSNVTTVVEQFRRHDADNNTTILFEENNDLADAVRAVESTSFVHSSESQVLVRHNIDDEGITAIKFGRSALGDNSVDVTVLSEIIDALTEARNTLYEFQGRSVSAGVQNGGLR